jgi:hypothetical protein
MCDHREGLHGGGTDGRGLGKPYVLACVNLAAILHYVHCFGGAFK